MTTTPDTPAQRAFTAPGTNIENQAYFDAAREGRLLLKHCAGCGQYHFYPRAICPHCFSEDTHWKESAGQGTIYSFSVMRRVPQPYAIAYVALDEGVTVMTGLVDCDFDQLAIGQRVRAVFRPTDGEATVPAFTPA
ncbi:MAG: Zn-ribbon domain-containing OB-fold protein [Burkholderiales bacterium]|nr:Zn-ribbon domain-containing OB-fold protein [Burkholderiales bacterium]